MSKAAIEEYLTILINQPVIYLTRAANMACFGFGEKLLEKDRKGEMSDYSSIALHIQCAWRIIKRNTTSIFLAGTDMYEPKSSDVWTRGFDWGVLGGNLFDEKAKLWIESASGVFVKDFRLSRFGDLFLVLSNDSAIEIFITSSDDSECWRLFERQSERKHLVVSGSEITF